MLANNILTTILTINDHLFTSAAQLLFTYNIWKTFLTKFNIHLLTSAARLVLADHILTELLTKFNYLLITSVTFSQYSWQTIISFGQLIICCFITIF